MTTIEWFPTTSSIYSVWAVGSGHSPAMPEFVVFVGLIWPTHNSKPPPGMPKSLPRNIGIMLNSDIDRSAPVLRLFVALRSVEVCQQGSSISMPLETMALSEGLETRQSPGCRFFCHIVVVFFFFDFARRILGIWLNCV